MTLGSVIILSHVYCHVKDRAKTDLTVFTFEDLGDVAIHGKFTGHIRTVFYKLRRSLRQKERLIGWM